MFILLVLCCRHALVSRSTEQEDKQISDSAGQDFTTDFAKFLHRLEIGDFNNIFSCNQRWESGGKLYKHFYNPACVIWLYFFSAKNDSFTLYTKLCLFKVISTRTLNLSPKSGLFLLGIYSLSFRQATDKLKLQCAFRNFSEWNKSLY